MGLLCSMGPSDMQMPLGEFRYLPVLLWLPVAYVPNLQLFGGLEIILADLVDVHKLWRIQILGVEVKDSSELGTLEVDAENNLIAFREKTGLKVPALINGGIYLFTDEIRGYMPQKDCFSIEYDVFPLIENAKVLRSKAKWLACDTPELLATAEQIFG